jgi:hypothetical protein
MKGQLLAALGIIISASSFAPASASPKPNGPLFPPFTIIPLSCSVNKTTQSLHITNTSRSQSTFKAGDRIVWNGSQGQEGEFNLTSDLAPRKSVDVKVNVNFDTCKAAFVK